MENRRVEVFGTVSKVSSHSCSFLRMSETDHDTDEEMSERMSEPQHQHDERKDLLVLKATPKPYGGFVNIVLCEIDSQLALRVLKEFDHRDWCVQMENRRVEVCPSVLCTMCICG